MTLDVFTICDAATDQNGKLNLLGAFNVIYVRSLPTVHPSCAVAIRIRFEPIESGRHPFRLNIIDDDGRQIAPNLEGSIDVRETADGTAPAANLILTIQGLSIQRIGTYQFNFALDGRQVSQVPLFIRQIAPTPQPQ